MTETNKQCDIILTMTNLPIQTANSLETNDSPRRKPHSTVVGRVMLSHDASLRKSEAASSRVAFSISMN